MSSNLVPILLKALEASSNSEPLYRQRLSGGLALAYRAGRLTLSRPGTTPPSQREIDVVVRDLNQAAAERGTPITLIRQIYAGKMLYKGSEHSVVRFVVHFGLPQTVLDIDTEI